jgi:hypothetical protein
MRRILLGMLVVLLAASSCAAAVGLHSLSLGLHLTPSVDRVEGRRIWDVSLSVSGTVQLDAYDSIECTVVVDSTPTTLGTIAEYRHDVTARFSAGAGMTILWSFDKDQKLLAPIVESFALATVHGALLEALDGELGVSFPIVTIANVGDKWKIIPLAGLPAVSTSLALELFRDVEFETHLTLQPVLVDATAFTDPIGRLTDNILVLPTISAYQRYFP